MVWIAAAARAATPQYQIFDIGVIQAGDTASQGFGVSPGGIAVGRSVRSNASQAFRWTVGGGLVGLPNLAGRNHAVSNDANDNGIVVGTAATTLFGSSRLPVIWNNGAVSQLPLPAGETLGDANGVNASGIAVGSVDGGSLQQAVIYNGANATVITRTTSTGCFFVTAFGINDLGLIVGQGIDPNNAARNVGFVYKMEPPFAYEVGALPGHNGALAFAVSNGGHIVGSSMMNQGAGLPFIWTSAAGMVAIPLASGTSQGSARGVNSGGSVVGQDSSAFSIPFLWDGTTTYRLADLLPAGSGWDLETNTSSSALGISENGVIVGTGVHNGETHAYAMVPVQGPATHFQVVAPTMCVRNTPCSFTVTARDTFNTTVTNYAGTVHFTSTDGAAQLPADGTLTNGTGSRSATFHTEGSQTITATDTVTPSITGTSNPIQVFHFDPTATPSPTPTATPSPTPTPIPSATPCLGVIYQENFDGVVAPNLPANWAASFTSGAADCTPAGTCAQGTNWMTTNAGSDTAPNCAFHNAPDCVTDSNLDTRPFAIPGIGGNQLYFRHNYNLESGRDGGVLEISIAGGAFTDIITAGGSFAQGGYNGTISTGFLSPIGGRPAWTGNSNGYITTSINLPPAASGQNVAFRFRLATDCGGAGTGWRVDTITGTLPTPCQTPTPPPPTSDYAIQMTDSPDPVEVGQNLTYSITVSNAGPDFGVNVMMTDTLPAGVQYVSAFPSQGSCTGTSTVTCNLGVVQSNASVLLVVKPTATGQLSNTANVASPGDPNPSNNSSTAVTTVIPAASPTPSPSPTTTPTKLADCGVAMSDSPDPVQVGQNLTYHITVYNAGPHPLPSGNIVMTANLPTSVNLVSVTPSQGSCTGTNHISCNLGEVQFDVTVTVVVTPTVAGTIGCGADIHSVNPLNDYGTASTTVLPAATPTPTPTPIAPTPTPTPSATPAQALNLATRLRVQSGDNVGIGGFIISGNTAKTVAIRGIGPSLAGFGISDFLADPTLELRNSSGVLLKPNDNWQDDPADAAQLVAHNLALQDPKESGIVATLQPGASYTAILAGKNQGTGVGLVEIYDINQTAGTELANISTRGFVLTGNNVMIGGFILGGGGNTRIVVRGIGPSLAQFGLNPVLADPTLELHDSNGATLVSNNDWQDDPTSAAQLIAFGLAPQNIKEAAIATSLPPGAFTGILAGNNGGTGIGLIEIYNVH